MKRLLVVDDNPTDRKLLRDLLTHEGFAVEEAADGVSALRVLYERHPDLVLLDVVMPAMDGWTACQRIRELTSVPIIMLTSLDREEEMVRGLELGADDFVSKPISSRHLLARVRAVLRRATTNADSIDVRGGSGLLYDDGLLRIDEPRHDVSVAGEHIELTPTEFRLLAALVRARDRVCPYAELLTTIWGPEYRDDIDFLRVYVWRLRKKLQPGSPDAGWITNERGFGYRFTGAAR